MVLSLIPIEELERNKMYAKALTLTRNVALDYRTRKHMSFIVDSETGEHNVIFIEEKPQGERWQCDCKWYTLQDKICSHIIAVNLAIINRTVKYSKKE